MIGVKKKLIHALAMAYKAATGHPSAPAIIGPFAVKHKPETLHVLKTEGAEIELRLSPDELFALLDAIDRVAELQRRLSESEREVSSLLDVMAQMRQGETWESGDKVKMGPDDLRSAIGMLSGGNQTRFAKLVGVNGRQVRRWLAGESGIPEPVARLIMMLEKEK